MKNKQQSKTKVPTEGKVKVAEEEEEKNIFRYVMEEGEIAVELHTLREDSSFHPGDTIKASLRLNLEKTLTIKDLKVHVKGYMKLKWIDTVGPKKKRECTVDKTYVDLSEQIKTAKPSKDGSVVFGNGVYCLPVKFELPENIPSSFEGERGFIRYFMSIRGKKDDKPTLLFLQRVKVVCPYDISTDPQNLVPWRFIEYQDVTFLWCFGGKLKTVFQLDKRAYIPGEFITLNGTIRNCSTKRMKFTKCSLTRKVTYIKDNWTFKVKKKLLAFVKHSTTKPKEVDYWKGEKLKIPSHMPATLLHCKNVEVKYILKLETQMALSYPSKHTLLNVVIKVGNIATKEEDEKKEKNGDDDLKMIDLEVK